ncbi:hypothetical protein KIPB_000697 [Kipferlia bialata]|uniref:Uncharacterized protein n=1 Tax=Kipferlia bialata TaxID=797122 RepID=A0A9K3GEW2_9EUKA|nr:hypothetical protein KIPB_000697 [Kipferlia bialata]|eukprot:g697.t1
MGGWPGIKSFVRGPSASLYDITTTYRSCQPYVELERDGEVYDVIGFQKSTTEDEFREALEEAGCLLH